ncbi:MAG: CinA family protein [Lachnospiraceae bacterium]|nr:CinA family protein [Lachnospiraceae bacterium]
MRRIVAPEAAELVGCLAEHGYHVSTAESCTGGLIASGIVDVSGASAVFEEGYITYADRIKEKLLGVHPETIAQHTVVSAQVAEEMASGMAKAAGTELAISVTGYAGSDEGADGTPAGTVYIGVSFLGETVSRHFCFEGDRGQVRMQAVVEAYAFALQVMKERMEDR